VDLLESDEHRDLRAAVGAIAASFGGAYYTEHARARTPCDELWTALGDRGFIGVNVAEEYGGGGGGLVELATVCEERVEQPRGQAAARAAGAGGPQSAARHGHADPGSMVLKCAHASG